MGNWVKFVKNQKFGFIFFITVFCLFGFAKNIEAKLLSPIVKPNRLPKPLIDLQPPVGVCALPPERPYTRTWNLNDWLRDNAAQEPHFRNLRTSQKGNIEPAKFSSTNWTQEILNFKTAWSAFVGPLPQTKCLPVDAREENLNLTPTEQAKATSDKYTMTKVTYQGDHSDRIPAYLFLPKNLPANQKVSAIVVMHQALAACGKKEPAGLCGKPWLNFAQDFAEKGYVVLAPDSIGYGERSVHYENTGMEYADAAPLLSRFPSSTLMGLRITDVMRGIDYLQTLPQVDGDKIGMIGHSNGAIESLFTAAFDERVKCSVSNAGPNLIRRETLAWGGNKPGISRWAGGAYIPAIGFFNNDLENLPIEIHQLYAMVAPRGLFISLMEDDSMAPKYDRIQFSMDQARRAFDALGGNFAYHTMMSGLTPANKLEWAGPLNITENYNRCKKSTDQTCASSFDAVGMTAAAVADKVYPEYVAHDLWKTCLEKNMNSESACIMEFANVGLTEASVLQAYFKYLKIDHGWYQEVENVAYPWLEDCLDK